MRERYEQRLEVRSGKTPITGIAGDWGTTLELATRDSPSDGLHSSVNLSQGTKKIFKW